MQTWHGQTHRTGEICSETITTTPQLYSAFIRLIRLCSHISCICDLSCPGYNDEYCLLRLVRHCLYCYCFAPYTMLRFKAYVCLPNETFVSHRRNRQTKIILNNQQLVASTRTKQMAKFISS